MAAYSHVADTEFQAEVLDSEQPVIVDFWAEWCGPCKMMAPVFEKLADEYSGKVKFVKVDTDANKEYATQFGVRGIPTLLFVKGGSEVDRIVGYVPESRIKSSLDKVA